MYHFFFILKRLGINIKKISKNSRIIQLYKYINKTRKEIRIIATLYFIIHNYSPYI